MNGQGIINSVMYDLMKIQTVSTDTNLRAMILDWLNRTIRNIAARHEQWTWLETSATFTTVANQLTYDLPSDCDLSGRKIITLRQLETPQKLIYVNQQRMDEIEADPTDTTGNPELYTIFGAYIRLWPTPDAVYTIYERYIKTITAYTDAADSTSDIPAKYEDVIVSGVLAHAYKIFKNAGDANAERLLFEAGVERMIQDNNSELDSDGTSYAHSLTPYQFRPPFPYNESGVGD